ncbi:MAG: efflux RND transporter permease subunit [Ignavibacteriales bacterium]|nr:efflux RND transporter permease subunit [Ignavibacteriales bacterium]
MKKLFYIFLSRPVTAAMFFFTIVILGLAASFNLPLELSPHVEFPRLTVTVTWQNVSPEAVESFVTSPIESELASIRGVKEIKSRSSEGMAWVSLEFYPEVDVDFARIEINEKISALKDELPFGVSPPRVSSYVPEDLRDLQGFITYTISSNESANAIRKYVKENMLYSIMSINGVEDVAVRGGNEREISIIVDYEKVRNLNISNEDITNSITNIEQIKSLGNIKKNGRQFIFRISNKIESIDDIQNQSIKHNKDGTIIKLKDIGKVIDDYREPNDYYRINGKETVSLIISKESGTNTLEIAERVYEKMAELESILPNGYLVIKEIDKSESIRDELNELTQNAFFSLFIIVLVLLLIFRSIKVSLIIITSIIFSLLFSFLLFFLFNMPLNILTISAFILGFGFMVDNSIVVIDFIEQKYCNDGIKRLTVLLKNIFKPVFASTLTTIAVFVPLLFLTGELRLYFEQFALGIVFTLFASLIVSFTIIPMLYIRFIRIHELKSFKCKISIWEKIYFSITAKIFKWKKLSIIILILIIGLPVWLLPSRIETPVLGTVYNFVFDSETFTEIKPYFNYIFGGSLNLFFNHVSRGEVWQFGEETYIYVRLELPNGNTIERINELTKDFEKEILSYRSDFKNLITNVSDEENASLRVEFTNKQSETSFPYILKNYLTSYATRLGGLNVSVYGFGPGFSNSGGSFSNFSVIVKGFNYKKVRELAENFRNQISRNPRIDNVDIDKSEYYWAKDVFEVVATIDRKNLLQFNISPEEVIQNIAKNTQGNLSWNSFSIDNDEVKYNIKFTNYKKMQISELENIIIKGTNGIVLKVKDLINFEVKKVFLSINRENQQYVRYVTFDYKGPYKYGNEFVKSAIQNMNISEGYSIEKREYSFRFDKEEEIDVWKILFFAIILIFMITASLFESFRKPIIIITAVPFAIIGTFFLFYFEELNLDRGAYAGLLLLIGLVVNNSIILVDHISSNINYLDYKKITEYSAQRLRPIFTTSLTTIAALVPLLLGVESTFWKSLSFSVVGGIFLSAVIVVLYLPLFYYLLFKKAKNIEWQ